MTNLEIITCDNCGACCMHMGYPPFIGMFDYDSGSGDPQWLALPRELAAEARQGAVDGRGSKEMPCVWLDLETKRCKHYDHRPDVCRDFEPGEPSCLSFRDEYGVSQRQTAMIVDELAELEKTDA